MGRTRFVVLLAVVVSLAGLSPGALSAAGRTNAVSGSGSPDRLELFVDAQRGDENGACRLPSAPCRTIQRALDSLPPFIRKDVVIRIAPGEYAGEVVISDRLSWDRRSLTLTGVAEESILDGRSVQRFGIRVSGSLEVRIEGLTVKSFNGDGVIVSRTEPVTLHDVVLAGNAGHGLSAQQTDVSLRGVEIDENWQDGIHCQQGWLTVRRHDRREGLYVRANGGFGLRAAACEVRFEGAALIQDNGGGLCAEHGAEIDLGGLTDIILSGNHRPPGSGQGPVTEPARPPVGINDAAARCEMIADHFGVIVGYQRARVDAACACGESGFGICREE